MKDDERAVFSMALYRFGERNQEAVAIEEMSELTKEIIKNWRGEDNIERIAEEIADVGIMLDQLILLWNCGGLVQAERLRKIERLKERLKEGKT